MRAEAGIRGRARERFGGFVRVVPSRRSAAAWALIAAFALLMVGCSGGQQASRSAGKASPGSAPGSSSAAAGSPTTAAGYYRQRLTWQSCSGGFQCARLLVPVTYRRPAGGRFSLPVIRLRAANQAQRIGSLVLNPGGPGGSGVQYARQARRVLSAAVLARFDVVGFDPRGVGGSRPAIRCMTGPQLDRYFQTDDTPDNAAEMAGVISASKFFARACDGRAGPLLPYVGTANAARDMDVLRSALGDDRLSYLGKSYGTYLGAYYAELFPHRVRALVLDGALDPASSAIGQNIVQANGFQVALRSFAADCVRRPDCPLGTGGTASAGLAKIAGLLSRSDRTPLANDLGDGRPANQSLITEGIAAALYSKAYWAPLRRALQDAFAGDGTPLIEFADALTERSSDGRYTNLAESNMAINCVDRAWPRSLSAWRSAAAVAARDAPDFGAPIMWGSLPCAYWPVHGAPTPRIRAAGAPPILVVGTTRDPATPYRWARALSRDLSSGVLLGWNGDGHTAYRMGSSCVDSTVDRYLIDGAAPKNGAICR